MTDDGADWVIPPGWHADTIPPSRCRSCGAPVIFHCSDAHHKKAPFERDGTPHFATCPQAGAWRKKR